MEEFIVAEITKNWTDETPVADLLSNQFEEVINFNLKRGYELYDWKITSFIHNEIMTETIIAIFKKKTDNEN